MQRSFDRKLSKVSMNQSETITKMAIDQAVILNKVTNVESRVKSIEEKLDKDYVTQDQFMPIQKVVYGLVAIILTSVFGGLVALVVMK